MMFSSLSLTQSSHPTHLLPLIATNHLTVTTHIVRRLCVSSGSQKNSDHLEVAIIAGLHEGRVAILPHQQQTMSKYINALRSHPSSDTTQIILMPSSPPPTMTPSFDASYPPTLSLASLSAPTTSRILTTSM